MCEHVVSNMEKDAHGTGRLLQHMQLNQLRSGTGALTGAGPDFGVAISLFFGARAFATALRLNKLRSRDARSRCTCARAICNQLFAHVSVVEKGGIDRDRDRSITLFKPQDHLQDGTE